MLTEWHWINLLMWNRTFDSFVVNSSSQLTDGILFLMFIATILAILSNNSQKNHISYFYHFHSTFLPYMEVDNSMQINCRNFFQHMNSITEIPRNKKQQLLSFFFTIGNLDIIVEMFQFNRQKHLNRIPFRLFTLYNSFLIMASDSETSHSMFLSFLIDLFI